MIKEFKEFISKGNVLDLAVGMIVGAAFTAIVTSLVNDILMPIIGGITGGMDFSAYVLKIGEATICWGNFVQAVVNFLIVAWVIFLVVKAANKFKAKAEELEKKLKKEEAEAAAEAPAEPSEDILLLREIRDSLKKN